MATILTVAPLVFRVVLPAVSTGRVSIRERIVRLIAARLTTITQANGYETDIGGTVTEGMLIDAEPPVLPCINFTDGAESSQVEAGMIHRSVQLMVETYDKQNEDPTPESLTRKARRHVVDVERALWRDPDTLRAETTFGGLAVGMTLLQSQPNIGQKPQPWIGSLSLYEIHYRTKAGNPYTSSDDED